jgi:hypothetical protein
MDWWTNAETFHAAPFSIAGTGINGRFDWATLAQSKFTFTTHCPVDKNFIDRCHRMGIRCFPYVSFYFGSLTQFTFGASISSTTYQGVDYSTPAGNLCFEWDQSLAPRNWVFAKPNPNPPPGQTPVPPTPDGVGVYPDQPAQLVCPNYQPYQDKMAAWVNYIMQQGADGIYVDNLVKRFHCYRKDHDPDPAHPHTHIYKDSTADPDLAQNQAFELLLSKVRAVVKSYKSDGLVLGNSGDPLNKTGNSWPGFQQYLDSDTLEGYTSTSDWAQGPLSWSDLGKALQTYLATGNQILAFSTLTLPPNAGAPSLRDQAFLGYCAARLAGLAWSSAWPYQDPALADLHRVRLGNPLTSEAIDPSSQIHYRVFERGIVAVNWDSANTGFAGQTIAAAALSMNPQDVRFFYDLYAFPSDVPVDASLASGLLPVPTNSGRVFLFASSTDYGLGRQVPLLVGHPPVPPPHPGHPPMPSPGPGPGHPIS